MNTESGISHVGSHTSAKFDPCLYICKRETGHTRKHTTRTTPHHTRHDTHTHNTHTNSERATAQRPLKSQSRRRRPHDRCFSLRRELTPVLVHLSTRNRSHTHTHTTRITRRTHTRTNPLPPPHTHSQQRSKVARRRCVLPPTPGWVAAPKSA